MTGIVCHFHDGRRKETSRASSLGEDLFRNTQKEKAENMGEEVDCHMRAAGTLIIIIIIIIIIITCVVVLQFLPQVLRVSAQYMASCVIGCSASTPMA